MKSATNLRANLFAMTALVLAATGCASTLKGPTQTLTVGQEHAEFVVEGRGRITGGTIACGSTAGAVCEQRFEDLWSTRLEAKPEPGWRFSGWKREVRNASVSPGASADERIVYTASFEKSDVAAEKASTASP